MLSPDQKQRLNDKLNQLINSTKVEIIGQNLIINNQSFTIPVTNSRVLSSTTKVSR